MAQLSPPPNRDPFIIEGKEGNSSIWMSWFAQLSIVVNGILRGTTLRGIPIVQDPIVLSSTTTGAHNLGVKPQCITVVLENKIAEYGYVPGDQIIMGPFAQSQAGGSGCTVQGSSTDITVITAPAFPIVRKDTHAAGDNTAANWILEVAAFNFVRV